MNLILTKDNKKVAVIDNIDLYNADEIVNIIRFQVEEYGRDWYIEGNGGKDYEIPKKRNRD